MKLDITNFQDTIENESRPVLVKFSAAWCGPCKSYAPVFDKFAEDNTSVACFSVDCDESRDLAEEFDIMSIPCTLLFKNGDLVQKKQGKLSVSQLEELSSQ